MGLNRSSFISAGNGNEPWSKVEWQGSWVLIAGLSVRKKSNASIE
jgi:hypothetical protein